MSLTAQEAFRFGFLLRCADEGLTPDEMGSRVKVAKEKAAAGRLVAALNFVKSLGMHGLAAGALAGGVGGHMLAKATDKEVDPDEAKKQELIAMYRQQADRARRTAKRIQYRSQAAPPRSMHF